MLQIIWLRYKLLLYFFEALTGSIIILEKETVVEIDAKKLFISACLGKFYIHKCKSHSIIRPYT